MPMSGRPRLISPLDAAGKTYPAGAVVLAEVDGEAREAVIDRRGQLWIGELLPATKFSIRHGGQRCSFNMPAPSESDEAVRLKPQQCEDAP